MLIKQVYMLPLTSVGWALLTVAGLAQTPRPQSTPLPTLSPTVKPTPACLDARKSTLAIEKVLTPEQSKLAKIWTAQGKAPKKIIADLKLTGEQKKALRDISRQQCKATPTPKPTPKATP